MNQHETEYKIEKYKQKILDEINNPKIESLKKKLNYYLENNKQNEKGKNIRIGDQVKVINSTYLPANSFNNSYIGNNGKVLSIINTNKNNYISVEFCDGSVYSFNKIDLQNLY